MEQRNVETLEQALIRAFAAKAPAEQDAATAALALKYAREIDSAGLAADAKLGAGLLAALESLHMSPRARATANKGDKAHGQPASNPLDQLAARRAGKSRAPGLDAAAP